VIVVSDRTLYFTNYRELSFGTTRAFEFRENYFIGTLLSEASTTYD